MFCLFEHTSVYELFATPSTVILDLLMGFMTAQLYDILLLLFTDYWTGLD